MHTLSPYQQQTMPSLAKTRTLAMRLAHVTGEPIAILASHDLFWLACPADRVTYWQSQIERGDVAIVETVGEAVTR